MPSYSEAVVKDDSRRPWVDPNTAGPDGLVGVGGELNPATLIRAYSEGVFPWFNDDDPILWWSPDPRGVLNLDDLHVSRSLARTIRSGKFDVTYDQAFPEVMRGCSIRPNQGTWITTPMMTAYTELHSIGHAHSVETWLDGELVGGIYGVTIGGLFAGESMFHRVTDASKVAVVMLVERLKASGFALFDVQIENAHTVSLGATSISRAKYLARLRNALTIDVRFSE